MVSASPGLEREPRKKSALFRGAILLSVIALIGIVFSIIDLAPDLAHVDLIILSGPQSGQYSDLADEVAAHAANQGASVSNVSTSGAAENIQRITQLPESERPLFALVPDGMGIAQRDQLVLVARLPKSDAVLFLGKNANRIRHLSDLKNMRIGIGPQGSGTSLIARNILGAEDLAGLGLVFSEHPFSDQIEKLKNGDLELGVFVTSENDPLMKSAIRDGLQVASFENAGAWPARFPALYVETLYSGHYDHVDLLPKTNKNIFRTDILVLANQSVSRSEVVALLVLLNETFHGFVAYNKNRPNDTGITQSKDLSPFIENGGPSLLDRYAPRLVNFMPPANMLHFVVVVSVLLNLLTGWHRLRLYFLDSRRIEIEDAMYQLFGTKLTLAEIDKLEIRSDRYSDEDKKVLDDLIKRCEGLRQRCRRYAPSLVTPLGQENIYRYHEGLITQQLKILRDFNRRLASG